MRDRITLRQLVYSDEWEGDIVYFIGSGESHKVKIGKSSNDKFTSRLGELQISSPYKLTVFGIIQGGTKKEASLHKRFRGSHYRGEWFDLTDDISNYIENETCELVQRKTGDTPKRIAITHKKNIRRRRQELGLKITPWIWCSVCKCYHELKREKQLEWPSIRCNKWGK